MRVMVGRPAQGDVTVQAVRMSLGAIKSRSEEPYVQVEAMAVLQQVTQLMYECAYMPATCNK